MPVYQGPTFGSKRYLKMLDLEKAIMGLPKATGLRLTHEEFVWVLRQLANRADIVKDAKENPENEGGP